MSRRHVSAGGSIVNVSSAASLTGSPSEYVACAAYEGAIESFTIGVVREVAQDGICVNGVKPGLVHIEVPGEGSDPRQIERLRDALPMRRGVGPSPVAAVILSLPILPDEASKVTG